jgi:hypothetical protein
MEWGRGTVRRTVVGAMERADPNACALRIGRIIGRFALVRGGEGCTARLFAADDLFLADQRVAIPALDEHPYDADHLIGPA